MTKLTPRPERTADETYTQRLVGALLNDIKPVIETAKGAPNFVGSSVEDAVAYADGFDVFIALWLDIPDRHGYGMEVVKATGGRQSAGAKLREFRSSEHRVGAAFVNNRAFALKMAELLGPFA